MKLHEEKKHMKNIKLNYNYIRYEENQSVRGFGESLLFNNLSDLESSVQGENVRSCDLEFFVNKKNHIHSRGVVIFQY